MFDLGFTELMVIALVALVVIGPERLPRVARTMGHLAGRLQRYVADVKADINREVELDELKKMRDSMQEAASGVESSFREELNKTESELNAAAEGKAEAAGNADADAKVEAEVSSLPQAAGSIEEKQKA
ncbi:MAG: Sec-independent protein translocase protein TatB [Betaproteobacteria bacterium]|nr:Sec-independent protein translocase protein TatB [Betaproteobacteria bacterium]MDH5211006.1 Sec-independent protein translocase protein TatB [Betaproteobacteria bacterium]MDH5577652.1 Sec-independent protein translocase protein TatB [Betaproteobacteria bacterium]